MDKIKQRIAIAQYCGWTECYQCDQTMSVCFGIPPKEEEYAPLPEYIGDLNAMYDAEQTLKGDQGGDYDHNLWLIVNRDWDGKSLYCNWHTTAAQRAEAFLKTIENSFRLVGSS